MNQDPKSPFNWRLRTEPSIFAKDPYFQPKGNGSKTRSQIATEYVESQRALGLEPGAIAGLGKSTKEKEERLLSYKHFGVYAKAKASKQPNKHEK